MDGVRRLGGGEGQQLAARPDDDVGQDLLVSDIQGRARVGSISGQDYYEFGVNEMRQSGLVWLRL